jgi:hypothetical protein
LPPLRAVPFPIPKSILNPILIFWIYNNQSI